MRVRLGVVAALVLALASACQSPPGPPPPPAASPRPSGGFDAGRAWADLNALAAIGPRAMATEGADQARAYLRGELEALGLEVVDQLFSVELTGSDGQPESLVLHNLAAAIPGIGNAGSSGAGTGSAGGASGVFLLVAAYDTRDYPGVRFVGANEGASGAAMVLELARALAADPLPYTVWVVFLEGEAGRSLEGSDGRAAHFGSTALARRIRRLDATDQVRLAVVFDRVGDADLRIVRDAGSYRPYRDEFWRAAERLGHGGAFPRDAPYESPQASHLALSSEGVRHVVALVDDRFGGDEPPGTYAGTEDDDPEHCSPESLAVVGAVTLAALDRIAATMAKTDRFAGTPAADAAALRLEQLGAERFRKSSTFNGTVRVIDAEGTRLLITGFGEQRIRQSAMDLEQPQRLVDPYTQIASMLTSLHPSPRRVFSIGLGGGVLPRFHLHHYDGSEVESVEIDPVVIEAAKQLFEVDLPRHTIVEGDGAAVLSERSGPFDVIWVDAYTKDEGIPDVFTERKFIDQLPPRLDSGGIVVANLYAKQPEAFDRLVADYKRDFSHGVRVTIPGSRNHIVALGDSPGISCAAFWEIHERWTSEGLADVTWTGEDPGCTDL